MHCHIPHGIHLWQRSGFNTAAVCPRLQRNSQKGCAEHWQNGAGQPDHTGVVPADRRVREVRLNDIKRPLRRTRANDQEKVKRLAASIAEIGLQEPIDVLEVEGQLYGFSGCHRYEAHRVLGRDTILCRIRKGSKTTLRMHMM